MLEPAEGHPHDVVLIKGDGLEAAEIVWDAGEPTEKVIPGGFLGAYMFSVPHGAPPGAHPVVVRKGSNQSTPMTFTVPSVPGKIDVPRPPGPTTLAFPPPRIDAVTLIGAKFDLSGVRATLYVQGANLDVGAIVSVTNNKGASLTPVASASHRVLRNQWYAVPHGNFGYPIYHYSSVIAVAGVRPLGQRIWVVATNLDGTPSEEFEYVLPTDAATIDSDGDSLRDVWETAGYDAEGDGVKEVDLPALGADPYRRDLFVELDIMDDVDNRPDTDKGGNPDSTVFDALRQMFASAPILNVGEAQGINLVIDASGKPCLTDSQGVDDCSFLFTNFDIGGQSPTKNEPDPFKDDLVRFSALKRENFDSKKRGLVYHYGIWGKLQINGLSGYSDDADDFLIAFDEFPFVPSYWTRRSQIEALAHELGHDLRQLHAGGEDFPDNKPNYLSVMSYSWVFRTAWPDSLRLATATCLPFYYASDDAKESPSGSLPENVNTIVDYSEGMGRPVMKPTPVAGASICGSTIDWNVVDPNSVFPKLEDFANWRSLKFDGPRREGNLP